MKAKGAKSKSFGQINIFKPPIMGQNRAIGFKTKEVDILDPIGFRQLLTHKNLPNNQTAAPQQC